MADGLFFTGTVFKNNRNLIQEENSRKQLAMQEEALNMKKEEAAAKRKKARQDQAESYQEDADLSGINDPRLAKALSNKVEEVNKFAADNYENQDDPTFRAELKAKRAEVQLFSKYLTKLDSTITTYNPLNEDAQNLRYKSDDDGNNLFELNLNNEIASFEDGTFDLNANIASFSDRYDKTIIRDMPTPDYQSYLDDIQTQYTDEKGNVYKGLADKDKTRFKENFINNHVINASTGTFKTTQAENTYLTGETFMINGDSYSGMQAFFKEKKGMQNVEQIKPEEEAALDPSNKELFDKDLHLEYVDYLADMVWKRESKGRKRMIIKEERIGNNEKGLTESQQAMLSIVSKPHETEVYGEVTLKDKVFTGIKEVKVNVTPDMMLEGQGDDAKDKLVKTHQSEVISGGEYDPKRPMPGLVIGVGQTMDGTPAAKVKAFNQVFLVPLELLYTEIKDANVVEKGGLGQAILESASGAVTETEAATPTSTKAPR